MSAAQISKFKQQLDLHYKAGGDTWCAPNCLDYLSITGIAAIPHCSGSSIAEQDYVWGVFTHAGSNGTANTAFFNAQAEPFREPIKSALSTWASCAH